MNARYYRYFVELTKRRSFTRTAEELYISQSTISKAIRSLEEEYEVQLIDRTAKGFRLTSEGEIFYKESIKLISQFERETEVLHALVRSKRGTLHLGVPPVTVTAIYEVLHHYRELYPHIDLRLLEVGANKVYSSVKEGEIDMGIIIQPFDNPDFVQMPILYSEAILLVPLNHPLAVRDTIPVAKLKDESFMLLTDTYMLRDVIVQVCEQAGFTPRVIGESAQWDLLFEAVANGEGVSILPKPIIDKICLPRVKLVHLVEPVIPWIPTVIYHKEKFLTSPMELFLQMLKDDR